MIKPRGAKMSQSFYFLLSHSLWQGAARKLCVPSGHKAGQTGLWRNESSSAGGQLYSGAIGLHCFLKTVPNIIAGSRQWKWVGSRSLAAE